MGRTFLQFAQRSMETLRRGTEVLEIVRQTSTGILNMATARVIGIYVLPETLHKLHKLHPEPTQISKLAAPRKSYKWW